MHLLDNKTFIVRLCITWEITPTGLNFRIVVDWIYLVSLLSGVMHLSNRSSNTTGWTVLELAQLNNWTIGVGYFTSIGRGWALITIFQIRSINYIAWGKWFLYINLYTNFRFWTIYLHLVFICFFYYGDFVLTGNRDWFCNVGRHGNV